jgi:flagellar basal-body rod protein FlgC
MGFYTSIEVSATGLSAERLAMDTIANNIANVNTVHPAGQQPFRASYLVAQEIGPALPGQSGQGVRAIGQVDDGSPPAVVSAPGNPLADANGNLTQPVVDLGVEMTNMIMANRSFQANGRTIETARDMYTAALRIGR